jgi:hypothetical protein
MFDSIFSDGSLRNYIDNNLKDPWVGTPFAGYVYMSPKQKGEFGERFVSKYLTDICEFDIKKAKTSTAGHDRIITGIESEIKFALSTRNKNGGVTKDKFIINHVSVCKDWKRLIFCGINEREADMRLVWFSKEDFIEHLNSDKCLFNVQQGGKGGGNDDYICTNVSSLLECSFVKGIFEW